MPQRCSLYLSHRGMSLHPFVKGLGRLAHFLIEKSSSKRGCSETISTTSTMGVLCTEQSEKKTKCKPGNFDPISCSIFKILPPEDCHVQGLSSRTKLNALTIFKAGLDATA